MVYVNAGKKFCEWEYGSRLGCLVDLSLRVDGLCAHVVAVEGCDRQGCPFEAVNSGEFVKDE